MAERDDYFLSTTGITVEKKRDRTPPAAPVQEQADRPIKPAPR